MNCKYFKTRTKTRKGIKKIYHYCTLLKMETTHQNCGCCENKEFKQYKSTLQCKTPMKNRSSKLNKREKNRYSIIYQDLTKCAKCESKIGIEKNEVFEGAYRQTSINYGMVVPFCRDCHDEFHNDIITNLTYKVMFQKEFMKNHSLEDFIQIFKQDYIYVLEQKKRS